MRSSIRRGEATQLEPGALRGGQFVGRRYGQNDFAQNIAAGVSVTNLKVREGDVFARTFPHSVILTLIFGLLVAAQQFISLE